MGRNMLVWYYLLLHSLKIKECEYVIQQTLHTELGEDFETNKTTKQIDEYLDRLQASLKFRTDKCIQII